MRTAVRSVVFHKVFICYVRDLYDVICDYISREWIGSKEESIRAFATSHDIDEKTVRRIRDWKTLPYRITIYTLEKICLSRDITLEEFFKKIKR
jgi:hypothetical protein